MALSVSTDTDNHNNGGGSVGNVYDRHHHLNHHGQPDSTLNQRSHEKSSPLAQDQWEAIQHPVSTDSWTTFGIQTENRARAASNPNPNTRRPSLRLHINNHYPPQQQRHQQLPMSVLPAPIPPPRPDLNTLNHANAALLAKQPHNYFSPLPNDRRLPLPHVPGAMGHRLPDLHAQNNSRSPSPRNVATTTTTTTPSTTTTSGFTPSPFSGVQAKGMNTANTTNSTPSSGSASSKRGGGFQLPFSTPSGSSSSPNLNATLPVVEEVFLSPQLPGSAAAGAGRRPLPVPPPPSRPASRNANPPSSVTTHTPVGPRVNSPLRSAPARGNERGPGQGHARSSSDVENGSEPLFYSSRKGKGRDTNLETSDQIEPPDPETLPYHERSEKWKGKQKMRDLPPSPTSPRSSTSPVRERTSPVFMSSAFPTTKNSHLTATNTTTTARRSPAHSPSLPTLSSFYTQHQEVTSNSVHVSSVGPAPLNTSSTISSDNLAVDLAPSLMYKSPISAKTTVASGGISKRAGIRRSGSVSSIRSNSSWRSSKSGHSVSGWAGKVFGGGSSAKQESHSANSSPVVPGPAFATPTNTSSNGLFNYDNNYSTYTTSGNASNTGTPRQPPTPRLLIPTTPSFLPPPPTHTQSLPTISSPVTTNARSPLPPVPPPAQGQTTPVPSMPGTISRRSTRHRGGYFVANRSSMESISSLAVKEQANGSVESLGSSGSGSSGGSAATVDAISLEREREPYLFYEGPGSRGTSQDSLSYSSSGLRTPSTPTHPLPSLLEGDIGHAHAGYDVDDERVYIDDGYDDPSHDGHGDLDVYKEDATGDVDLSDLGDFEAAPGKVWDEHEFETRWSGLVIGDGKDDSPLSPMIYARDEEDVDSDSEDLGGGVSATATPRGKGMVSTAVTATTLTEGAAADGFVYISSGGSGGSRTVSRSATVVTGPSRQPSLGRSAQPAPALQVVLPGEVLDDPTDILGDETEMVFASHTSPARRERGTSYVLGLGGLDDEDSDDDEREFVRGKWRRRKPSPEIGAMRVVRSSSVGPLRRYQSEESISLGVGADDDNKRGAQTLPAHSVDAVLRLTPNRYIEPEPLGHRSRLHQGHSSISIPHNINYNSNKPLPSSVFNHEPVFTSGPGALVGVGGLPGQFPFLTARHFEDPRTQRETEKERDESHSIRSNRSRKTKSDHNHNTKRGLSVPSRDQPKEVGKEHVRKQLDSLAPKQVSYDLWVGRGIPSTTPPEKKKGVLSKTQT